MAFSLTLKGHIETDDTIRRAKKYGRQAARAFPTEAPKYLLAKVPVVNWLPKYDWKWILPDVIAGVTMGVLLIPQGLAYAKIATISSQYGLITSFSPSAVYFIMGTSKDVSIGPTSIIALLTSQTIKDLKGEGFSAENIAAALAFLVAIYCWILGLLQLGWILDFISLPVLTGFVSAAALVIISGQIPPLFGLKASSGEADLIHDFFVQLPETQWETFVLGFSGIVLLVFFQQVGRRWGRQYKAIWVISILRNAIVLLLFTTISYFLNRNLPKDKPLFPLTSTVDVGLVPSKLPNMTLVGKLTGKAIAVFIAASLEHLAIGKAFGRRNGYTIDQAQELNALGTTNFLNSLFGGMAVSGAISRTSVNSESGVKSPLSGLVTTGMVLVSIYELTGVLYWIPKATLSAIIVTAVWQIVVPIPVFYKYWRTSLVDFIGSQIAFWLTLFVSAERGIEIAVAFHVLYTAIRVVFARTSLVTSANRHVHYPADDGFKHTDMIPSDTKIFKFHQSILFPNAERVRNSIMDAVQTYSMTAVVQITSSDRMWSDSGERKIRELRDRAGVNDLDLPLTSVVVLDLTNVTYIDTTGLQALADLKADLYLYCGPSLELRFVGMHRALRKKFDQIGWLLSDASLGGYEGEQDGDVVFEGIGAAIGDVGNFRVFSGDKSTGTSQTVEE